MIGTVLKTLCISLNGDSAIEVTLLNSLVNIAKATLEGERDWMALRKTDTSLSISASTTNQWNTSLSLSDITDFLRFYGDYPIRIFDGNNKIEYYRQVPFSKRLEYKDIPNTFVHDIANKKIYLNGTVVMSGTLYINYIINTSDIDVDGTTDIETNGTFPFPSRFHPLLAFYAVGISKGAVDYDSINREMLPSNQVALFALKNAMLVYDTKMQLAEVAMTDTDETSGRRFGSVDMST